MKLSRLTLAASTSIESSRPTMAARLQLCAGAEGEDISHKVGAWSR
jgi:hypothetical protein